MLSVRHPINIRLYYSLNLRGVKVVCGFSAAQGVGALTPVLFKGQLYIGFAYRHTKRQSPRVGAGMEMLIKSSS